MDRRFCAFQEGRSRGRDAHGLCARFWRVQMSPMAPGESQANQFLAYLRLQIMKCGHYLLSLSLAAHLSPAFGVVDAV